MPTISKRGQEVPLSPFRKLVPVADRAKARGKHVYHLNIGQPDIETPASALDKIRSTNLKVLAYSPAIGIASYREKLVGYYRHYGVDIDPEHLIITTGASEAIQFILLSCLNPGDEIIIPEPFYANYNGFSQIANTTIKPITCRIEDGFALPDAVDFEAQISERTKAIFLTNPNNPTGCYYPESVLRELGKIVKKHDLYLFVDEVYREFCYDGATFFSVLNLEGLEDNVVVLDSISKRYSACGARVGTLVTRNDALIETVTRYAKLRLSPPGLGQILAEGTLEMEDNYIGFVQEEYDRRRQVVYRRLRHMPGVVSYKPGGAFYCFAKFPVDNADDFCKWLLEDFEHEGATVMLSPGEGFYATPGLGVDEVRIAYVLNTKDLEAAMDCLEKGLTAYPKRLEKAKIAEPMKV